MKQLTNYYFIAKLKLKFTKSIYHLNFPSKEFIYFIDLYLYND